MTFLVALEVVDGNYALLCLRDVVQMFLTSIINWIAHVWQTTLCHDQHLVHTLGCIFFLLPLKCISELLSVREASFDFILDQLVNLI